MATKITKFDAADYLNSDATIAAYFNEALGTGDEQSIKTAINTIARAKRIAVPTLRSPLTLRSVIKATSKLGFDLTVVYRR